MVMQQSVQRSFRLSPATAQELDAAAAVAAESRNAMVDRLLRESLRIEAHPLIRFRTGAAGRREPALVGTRLLVRDIVATVRESDDLDDAAEYLGLRRGDVAAVMRYAAQFADEIDDDLAWARAVAEREQRAFSGLEARPGAAP